MTRQPAQVVFEDGLMLLMDGQNQGFDCLDLCDCSFDQANLQIDRWDKQFAFDVEAARRELTEYFDELEVE